MKIVDKNENHPLFIFFSALFSLFPLLFHLRLSLFKWCLFNSIPCKWHSVNLRSNVMNALSFSFPFCFLLSQSFFFSFLEFRNLFFVVPSISHRDKGKEWGSASFNSMLMVPAEGERAKFLKWMFFFFFWKMLERFQSILYVRWSEVLNNLQYNLGEKITEIFFFVM